LHLTETVAETHPATGNPWPLHLVAKVRATRDAERTLHRSLADRRLTGGWYAADDFMFWLMSELQDDCFDRAL
jgi:hypothetical protein